VAARRTITTKLSHAITDVLTIAYLESGSPDGVPAAGHNLPQETPQEVVCAVTTLADWT
jgi:hypothetical protein